MIQETLRKLKLDQTVITFTVPELYEAWELRKSILLDDVVLPSGERGFALLHKQPIFLNFLEQARKLEEFLLVSHAYDEAKTFWTVERNLEVSFASRHHFAYAQYRMGSYERAKNELSFAELEHQLDEEDRYQLNHLLGLINWEDAHYTPQAEFQYQKAKCAREHFRKAANSNTSFEKVLEVQVFDVAMGLLMGPPQSEVRAETINLAQGILNNIEEYIKTTHRPPSFPIARFTAALFGVQGDKEKAAEHYRLVSNYPEAKANLSLRATIRHHARMVAETHGFDRNTYDPSFGSLKLIVFAGHYPDSYADQNAEVERLLDQKLEQLEARVGISSASAGGDLLFLSSLLNRKGKVHVVLPWHKEDFVKEFVAAYTVHGDPSFWNNLFDRVCREAESTRELGHQYNPEDDAVSLNFSIDVLGGIAILKARMSYLDIQPLVLWNGKEGHTGQFVRFWKDLGHKNIPNIWTDLPTNDIHGEEQDPIPNDNVKPREEIQNSTMGLQVKSMLFADIEGYSKLKESCMKNFVELFLCELSCLLASTKHPPVSINTWGDSLYAVFDFTHDAAVFALELSDLFKDRQHRWMDQGLLIVKNGEKIPLQIRIGLHAGPVLCHFNPILREIGFTGSHVSRAARIEPVTQPGEIYASEELTALVQLERELRDQNGSFDLTEHGDFRCEYAGTMPLAKGYPGQYALYRIVRQPRPSLEELVQAARLAFRSKTAPIVHWEQLTQESRDSYIDQVKDIPAKLKLIEYALSTRGGIIASSLYDQLTLEQRESLAKREHERWIEFKKRKGYGDEKSGKSNSLMIPWEKLNPSVKEKNVGYVERIFEFIELAGFRVRKTAI